MDFIKKELIITEPFIKNGKECSITFSIVLEIREFQLEKFETEYTKEIRKILRETIESKTDLKSLGDDYLYNLRDTALNNMDFSFFSDSNDETKS